MQIQIVNKSNNALPAYATIMSAGMDIRAFLEQPITLAPGKRVLVPTGLYIALPVGYEARFQPRSGLALKNGVTLCNSPGCVDADYRGELGAIVINHGDEPFTINNGDRICQMIISQYEQADWVQVDSLPETGRGVGGFGHTGVK